MKKLFIIGNGFDLNLGLKTKYIDYLVENNLEKKFFEYHMKVFSYDEKYLQILSQKNLCEKGKKELNFKEKDPELMKFEIIEKEIKEFYKTFEFKISEPVIEKLCEISKKDNLLKYLEEKHLRYVFGGCKEGVEKRASLKDFRSKIIKIENLIDDFSLFNASGNWYDVEKEIKELIKYIFDKKSKRNSYLELIKKRFPTKASAESKNIDELILKKEYINPERLLTRYENDFKKYIKKINCEQKNLLKEDKEINKLKLYLKTLLNLEDDKEFDEVYLYNFNYTTYLEKFFKNKINVHGDVDRKERIIFGIDSEVEMDDAVNKNVLLTFSKESRMKNLSINVDDFLNDDIKEIYILGHSFSDVDKMHFEKIFIKYQGIEIKILVPNFKQNAVEEKRKELRELLEKIKGTHKNIGKIENIQYKIIEIDTYQ